MEYLPGVSALYNTLNNEKDVEAVMKSLIDNGIAQIVVIDGGSTDRTVEIAKKYSNDVYVTEKGIAKQHLFGLTKAKHHYMLGVESDHRFPPGFLDSMIQELESSPFFGLQATLKCLNERNWFEKGMAIFYEVHQMYKGERPIIGGPPIYRMEGYKREIDVVNFEGYSIDTKMCEEFTKKGYKLGLGHTTCYQVQELNARVFFKKYFSYGKGDYQFYEHNKKDWTLKRRLQSLTHVFRQYGIKYPWRTIKIGKPQGIPYLWLSAIVRYSGWISCVFKGGV